jgi:hypothetical protein
MVSQFLYSGYVCYLKIPFKQYVKMDQYGRKASLLEYTFPASKNRKYSVVVSDDRNALDKYTASLKSFLNLHIFTSLNKIESTDMFYPITLHPDYLLPELEENIYSRAAISNNRQIAAIFAGNVDADYNREDTKKYFHINTRRETFSCIESELSGDMLYMPKSLDDLIRKMERGELRHKIVLLNICDFRIPNILWFKILLNSDFFIHMCGYWQPYCHNEIESMLAGCIPITQFSRFFIPRFNAKVNALTFDNLEELVEILKRIVKGEYRNSISPIRENVLKYYMDHYSFQSFKNKIYNLTNNNIKNSNYYIYCEEDSILRELAE